MKKWIGNAALIFSSITPVMAEETPQQAPSGWLWGVGVFANQGIYKDVDPSVLPLPLIGYRGERLSILGPYVSYDVFKQDNLTLALRIAPTMNGYEESDSDVFEGMNDRDFSLGAGLGANYQLDDWRFEVNTAHDILDRSDGYELTATMLKSFRLDAFSIEPSLGVVYQDSNYVDYYYGVKSSESTATRPEYTGDDSINTQIGLAVATPKYFGGITRLQLQNTWYDDNISDSPLTDSDSSLSLNLIYTRFF